MNELNMKSFKYLFTVMLCVACLSSCNEVERIKRYNEFNEIVTLSGDRDTISSPMLYPRNIFISDNKLVVLNEKTDTLFQVFSLPDLHYAYSFGIKGEGPEDFNMPAINVVSYEEDGFTLLDVNKLKHIHVSDEASTVSSEVLPFDFPYYNGMMKLSDSLYCCDAGLEEDKEYMFLRLGSEPVLRGEYPENVDRFKETLARNQAYDKITVVKPGGGGFASFYRYTRRYRIYDSEGTLLDDVILDIAPGNKEPDAEGENNYIHAISAFATENYIYTLNLDMVPKEIMEGNRMPNIQVFDWDGVPVKQYLLDRFISSFAVDEKGGKIYGVFVDDADGIYTFKM